MTGMIGVTEEPIMVQKVLDSVRDSRAGGIVHFIGSIREEDNLEGIFYEAYPAMVLNVFKKLSAEALKKWPLQKVAIVHRIGWIPVGEEAVVIAVSSAHRAEAFEACRFLIDTLKREAPIWKRDNQGCCGCS